MNALHFSLISRTRPLWRRGLLALGLLVILMQGVALARSMPSVSVGGLPIEVCTAHGMQTVVPGSDLPGDLQTQGDAASSHDCCVACVLGAPTPTPAPMGAVSPAPTSRGLALKTGHSPAGIGDWRLAPARAPPG